MSNTSSHSSHGNHGDSSNPGHEPTDINFNRSIWLIPIAMVLLILYAYICWFGASKTLKREIASKQVPVTDSTSSTPSSGTP